VPLYVASTPSNVRDQPPFASPGNTAARAAYGAAQAALQAGDSVQARTAFVQARDLDVVRFRAPSVFDSVVRRVVQRAAAGVTYVPMVEAFAAQSVAGVPGRELFLEHVHPNRAGVQLLARTFLQAMIETPPIGTTFDETRVRSMADYERTVAVTPFDERIAAHRVAALGARWPFVPLDSQGDYRGRYIPTGSADSLAFLVAGGARPWEFAKLELARRLEAGGNAAQAIQEYLGLAGDQFIFAEPHALAGAALFRARRFAEADTQFVQAMAIAPTADLAVARARIAGDSQDWPAALAMLDIAQKLDRSRADVLYQLSLAQSLTGNTAGAQQTARELQRQHPQFPGLPQLLTMLGLPR
jgi:tetratricopeptide (TPR) repeat protein